MSQEATFYLHIPTLDLEFRIENGYDLGSKLGSKITIPSQDISPTHAVFKIHNGVLSIMDAGSLVGTFLADKKLVHQKVYLLDIDDKLTFGTIDAIISDKPKINDETIQFENMQDKTASDAEVEKALTGKKVNPPKELQLRLSKKDAEKESLENVKKRELNRNAANSAKFLDPIGKLISNSGYKSPPLLIKLFSSAITLFLTFSLITAAIKEFELFDTFLKTNQFLVEESAAAITSHTEKIASLFPAFTNEKLLSILKVISPYLFFLFAFVPFQILFSILFGRTIGEFFCAISYHNGFLANRLLSILRLLLSPFLSWTVIGTLPSLIKRRSLLEFITLSKVHCNLGLSFVGIPLAIFLILAPHNYKSFDLLTTPSGSTITINDRVSHLRTPELTGTPTPLTARLAFDQTLLKIPFLIANNEQSKGDDLIFLNLEADTVTRLAISYYEKTPLNNLLALHIPFSPLFPVAFKSLFDLDSRPLDEKSIFDAIKFIKAPFLLSPELFKDYLSQTLNPFTDSQLPLKEAILGSIQESDLDSIAFIKLRNAYFLKLSYRTVRQGNGVYYIPLSNQSFAMRFESSHSAILNSSLISLLEKEFLPLISTPKEKGTSLFSEFEVGKLKNATPFMAYLDQIKLLIPQLLKNNRHQLRLVLNNYLKISMKYSATNASYNLISAKVEEIMRGLEQ